MSEVDALVPPNAVGWNFDNSYSRLPPLLFRSVTPARVPKPSVAIFNNDLAREMGLDFSGQSDVEVAAIFAGQVIPDGAQPIAQAYAGHQYGGFTMLGDGRAILLGEHLTPSGERFDIQFKGSGRTPFSRSGDGKAALGPMLREYIISEAMHAMGIPSTRSMAVVSTGENVYRESVLPGAILTRVAASHIRVGTFQFLAAVQDTDALRVLADYTIARHYASLVDEPERYIQFFRAVCDRQAALIAKWQAVGFVHGVMNTDNMAIAGESIDYGPCAFMDVYDPDTVFSSIDHGGRYAYANQPSIAQWNLARLAETLLPLIDVNQDAAIEIATGELNAFMEVFQRYAVGQMRAKLGLVDEESSDLELISELLDWMHTSKLDYTNTFDDLTTGACVGGKEYSEDRFRDWYQRWQERLARTNNRTGRSIADSRVVMRRANPRIIPRNHRVEAALAAASEHGDFSLLHRLLAAVQNPYDSNPVHEEFRSPSTDGQCYRTFCGT